jgi:hypothetical protein
VRASRRWLVAVLDADRCGLAVRRAILSIVATRRMTSLVHGYTTEQANKLDHDVRRFKEESEKVCRPPLHAAHRPLNASAGASRRGQPRAGAGGAQDSGVHARRVDLDVNCLLLWHASCFETMYICRLAYTIPSVQQMRSSMPTARLDGRTMTE